MWEARDVHALAAQASERARPLAETFRNPGLRRLQLAWLGSILGSGAYLVALAVYAYAHGGAGAVALVGVLQMIPAAVVAPFSSALADRFPRRLVLVGADTARAAWMSLIAASIALGGPAWIVYALVTVSVVSGTPFRPAQAALMPTLARTPAELTAANVTSSTFESVGYFVGPAVGGFLLAATNAQTVFALNAGSFVWSALLVVGIRVTEPVATRASEAATGPLRSEALAGFRTVRRDRSVRLLVSLYSGQTLVAGALGVFVVVTALQLLHGNARTVGTLNAAIGAGGLIGGGVAVALAARRRLAADLALGLALFGSPFLAIAALPNLAPAVVGLALLGVGNSLVDISAITLLQRIVPDEVLGRVLGLVQGILLGSLGVGAALAPLLIHLLGARTALLATGIFLPACAAGAWPRLRRLDAPEPAFVELLRGVGILAPLAPQTLDRLARALVEVHVTAGAEVVRKGETGDRFYVIESGEVEVEDSVLGPGESFGEIALLRDVPRTATVIARTDVVLRALERGDFLPAVTGHAPSSTAADAVIALRLGELRSDLTTEPGAA
jgi:MFS family permease